MEAEGGDPQRGARRGGSPTCRRVRLIIGAGAAHAHHAWPGSAGEAARGSVRMRHRSEGATGVVLWVSIVFKKGRRGVEERKKCKRNPSNRSIPTPRGRAQVLGTAHSRHHASWSEHSRPRRSPLPAGARGGIRPLADVPPTFGQHGANPRLYSMTSPRVAWYM